MKNKRTWLPAAAAALTLLLCCAALASAQTQHSALRCIAVRWPGAGLSPARLEDQLELFREDGQKDLPEMTLWGEFPGQTAEQDDESSITCSVIQIYGHGEDVIAGALRSGSYPLRGDTGHCALSNQAAFDLFGSAEAMGQQLQWEGRDYTVQAVFESSEAVVLVQAPAGSTAQLPHLQLRFRDGGSRQQAEEFLARTDFSGGALLLDMPLIAWGLQTLAALPALLLGGWIFLRLLARAWQRRKYPRLLLRELPLLLPLAAADLCLLSQFDSLPPALIPSRFSDFSFWSELPKSWSTHISAWLRSPTAGDIALLFAALGIAALTALALLPGVWLLSRVRVTKAAHVLIAWGGCLGWLFLLALYFGGLQLNLAVWLLPGLWLLSEFGLNARRREGSDDTQAKEAKPSADSEAAQE